MVTCSVLKHAVICLSLSKIQYQKILARLEEIEYIYTKVKYGTLANPTNSRQESSVKQP